VQAIGLLIGMEDVSPEKQSEYLAALLNPLCQQVKMSLKTQSNVLLVGLVSSVVD